jgi:diketogulonate reductase-like aldo/keto reductase
MNLVNRKEATVSQIALAWVLSQKPWIVPIPGTTKLERLEENLRSVDLEFTPEEWRDLNHAVSKIKLQGIDIPQIRKLKTLPQSHRHDCVSRLCALPSSQILIVQFLPSE